MEGLRQRRIPLLRSPRANGWDFSITTTNWRGRPVPRRGSHPSQPAADLLYSDEDKITERPPLRSFFKPNWSPDLLLSENYMCHLLVIAGVAVDQNRRFP